MSHRCLDCAALIARGSRCPVHQAAYQAARNAKRGPNGWAVAKVAQMVRQRDAGQPCALCRRPIVPGEAVHVDHVVPVARGGGNGADNLRAVHARCNLARGAR